MITGKHPSAGPGYAPQPPLADLGARLGARVLDVVFWFIGYFVPAIPITRWIDAGGGTTAQTVLLVWLTASLTLYFPLCVARFGSTLGKRICGVRVVRRETGLPVGFGRALGREFFWLVTTVLPVPNALWCCWDKPFKQCLQDKVADTMVVVRNAM